MSFTEQMVLTEIRRLTRRELRLWVHEGWVRPAMSETGPLFDDLDVARLRLLCDLRKDSVNRHAKVTHLVGYDHLKLTHLHC